MSLYISVRGWIAWELHLKNETDSYLLYDSKVSNEAVVRKEVLCV